MIMKIPVQFTWNKNLNYLAKKLEVELIKFKNQWN